ncbi:cysteine proteinase [Macrolepiota fuliginosa MF-IS2]|uniref:ubiquitinyl hydrolase 1 n=1 Tax=Macrolepiota fuliginosa MF-IS2 TaxID=1400762 RepID=A0A9P5XB87_9AGAR|nr:cysteine proteinase [Macrolepiota fuliginosa MF-IS2]
MDNKESPRPRRPLPVPGATRSSPAQRPNTPIEEPVPPSSFYSSDTQTHNPISERPNNVGSSNTLAYFVAPDKRPKGYREPELVSAQEGDEDSIPPLTDPNDTGGGWSTDQWNQNFDINQWTNANASGGWDGTGYYSTKNTIDVPISGRQEYEEKNWWDPRIRATNNRPGSGMLPPVLLEELHDPDHALFSVSVTNPNIPPPRLPPENSGTPSPTPSATSSSAIYPTPTEDEVRTSVPHPNAYYCPRDNGWVILSWKSSSITPPFAESFENTDHPPLPNQSWRKQTNSCTGDEGGQLNKTHHFHKYPQAVDALKLTPPLKADDWDTETMKAKRRLGTSDNSKKDGLPDREDTPSKPEEGRLLDLYICCQCSFYCVASDLISGVIPRKYLDAFVKDKRSNPLPGKTGEQAVVIALETIMLALENILWKGEVRALKVNSASNTFQSKVGWNTTTQRIFQILGFSEDNNGNEFLLSPPNIQQMHHSGRVMRRKLLRAWVETGAWLENFRRKYDSALKVLKDLKTRTTHVKIDHAREMYQMAVGAHPDQIPRNELSAALTDALTPVEGALVSIGLTFRTYSPELLAFGYFAQCRCDPAKTFIYFTHLTNIVRAVEESGEPSPQLQDLLISESMRDRFAIEDLEKAASVLGFGMENDLGVELDDDVEDDFIENAWKETVKKSWKDFEHGSDLQRKANEALRIIAEAKGRTNLRQIWQTKRDGIMSPERAYKVLEVPESVDEHMLITVFNMRIDERPTQIDTMREALSVIAETRDSERLRQFLATGQDLGDIRAEVSPDFPRGLNQLGNTCYLNSLLQYFYTIKDLRETVLSTTKLDVPLEEEKLTDDDLKRHRVGGRLVTRREIIRSKKFLNQLADLFSNLEYCKAAAVTPTIELAKLALVTSRDEEDDELEKGGTDSSNDTDATLVDDGVIRPSMTGQPNEASRSPPQSPNSVLGKRARDEKKSTDMEIDSPVCESPKDKEGFVFVTSPPRPSQKSPEGSTPEPSSSKRQHGQQDVEMRNATPSQKPPPLPPRKKPEQSSSEMMFGKQHDVAECMDNCMFQIETALLKFSGNGEADGKTSEKASVVKRLFFGKIKQRLTGIADARQSRASVHDKTDLFSHLPVNVAEDGIDIYDGLSGYFDDVVEFQGKKARMEMSLLELPPILQIQLQRVQFNRETLQPYKSQAYVRFWETIYLDRFMDDAESQKKIKSKALQSELNECRERLRILSEGKNAPFATSIEQSISFLSGLENSSEIGVDDELIFHLNKEQAYVMEEIEQLRQHAKILKNELETLWSSSKKVEYELTSVFIHRGASPSWGHYFFYSRHLPDAPDSWFKYNDSDVSSVSKDEVLADTTGSTANPYLLVFARKGSNVVDTVKRFRSDIESN